MAQSLGILLALGAFVLMMAVATWPLAVHAMHGLVLNRLSLSRGMQVVDIGCGPGRLTARIAKEVGPTGHVVGIDPNLKVLRAAEQYANARGLKNLQFIVGGAGEGKLDHARFDRAVLVAVLGEITDRRAALDEIFQVLKPGGLLSVTEVATDPHRQSEEKIRRLAEAAGFVEQAWFDGRLVFTVNLRKPA